MRILLDTHIALWALSDDSRLSTRARALILNPENAIYYSVVSVWEVLLKHQRRPQNLELTAEQFMDYCQQAGFLPLSLSDRHVLAVNTLMRSEDAPAHNDPFDRLLIAQAKEEQLSFMTHDSLIPYYGEECIIPV